MKRKNAKDYNCWQKPWTSSLTPLKKSNFCDFVKSEFLQSRKTIPLARTSPTLLCDIFRVKRKNEINYNFRQKPWISLRKNSNSETFSNRSFYSRERPFIGLQRH